MTVSVPLVPAPKPGKDDVRNLSGNHPFDGARVSNILPSVADELNLDGMLPPEVKEALPVVRARCEEIGRDPASLAVSVHTWPERPGVSARGAERVDLLAGYRELGISRLQIYLDGYADDDSSIGSLAEDSLAAGATLEPTTA